MLTECYSDSAVHMKKKLRFGSAHVKLELNLCILQARQLVAEHNLLSVILTTFLEACEEKKSKYMYSFSHPRRFVIPTESGYEMS